MPRFIRAQRVGEPGPARRAPACTREQIGGALLGDDFVVLRVVEREVELVRRLQALAAHQCPQRANELRHGGVHTAPVHQVECLGQGEVARQHRRVVAVLQACGQLRAPRVDLVDDVVMKEGGEVDQLDGTRELDQALVDVVQRAAVGCFGRQNQQDWTQALAAVVEALERDVGLAELVVLDALDDDRVATVDDVAKHVVLL